MKNNNQIRLISRYLDRLNMFFQQEEDFIWQRHEYMMQNEFDRTELVEKKYLQPLQKKIKYLAEIILEEMKK